MTARQRPDRTRDDAHPHSTNPHHSDPHGTNEEAAASTSSRDEDLERRLDLSDRHDWNAWIRCPSCRRPPCRRRRHGPR